MVMTTKSRKAKGRKLQQHLAHLLRMYAETHNKNFSKRDIDSTSMGVSGPDIKLSGAAFSVYPFDFECKSRHSFAVYSDMAQIDERNVPGYPALVIKANNKEPMICFYLNDFLEFYWNSKENNNA